MCGEGHEMRRRLVLYELYCTNGGGMRWSRLCWWDVVGILATSLGWRLKAGRRHVIGILLTDLTHLPLGIPCLGETDFTILNPKSILILACENWKLEFSSKCPVLRILPKVGCRGKLRTQELFRPKPGTHHKRPRNLLSCERLKSLSYHYSALSQPWSSHRGICLRPPLQTST